MELICIVIAAVTGVICAVTGILTALPLLGFDIRILGRSAVATEAPSLDGRKIKKVWIALGLSILSICISCFAAYYFFRPRIVEKIVEKLVPQDCFKPASTSQKEQKQRPSVVARDNGVATGTINQGPASAFSQNQQGGITAGTVIVSSPPFPKVKFTQHQLKADEHADLGIRATRSNGEILELTRAQRL